MKIKYKCLVLDHDDTVVNSTATIHYPCFIEYLKERGSPLAESYTLNEYFEKNSTPGILAILRDEVGLNEQEIKEEEEYWSRYVKNHVPGVCLGMKEIMADFLECGGILAVDSHSLSQYIKRDYEINSLPSPHVIYGWDIPPVQRKPSPHTLFDLMERYSLSPRDILVVDDLKPGFDMARAAGVDFAAAGWAYDVPKIESFMRENCDYYLKTTQELRKILFE